MMRNVEKYGISETKIQSKFQQLYLIFEIKPIAYEYFENITNMNNDMLLDISEF